MVNSMTPMFGQMAESMLDGTLRALEKEETAIRLATFVKQFYDTLIDKGFTKEEALKIVTALGVPSVATGR